VTQEGDRWPSRALIRQLDGSTAQTGDGVPVHSMALDANRLGDVLHVDVDLPGVDPESIEITVEKDILTMRAEHQRENQDAGAVVHERPACPCLAPPHRHRARQGDHMRTSRCRSGGCLHPAAPVREGPGLLLADVGVAATMDAAAWMS